MPTPVNPNPRPAKIWGLQMATKRKARLVAVFGLGLFAVTASLVRLGMTKVLQSSTDATYNLSEISLWAMIELNIGLICSCLMLLPAFLRHHLPESTKSSLRSLFSTATGRGKSTSRGGFQGYRRKLGSTEDHTLVTIGGSGGAKNIIRTDSFTFESETARSPSALESADYYLTSNSAKGF
ncbi:hypothetical protein GGR56DRAFT_624245 [Xylariaceae sp. FL0804]|nr:hypothetical protein GGR56DRAFT_624245 [Xylariaceae sp. FL0804]